MKKAKTKETITVDENGGWRTAEQQELLRRVFQGMEIVDSEADLYVKVTEADKVGARPRDLTSCVFSQASKRLYDSTCVVFFKRVAYVDLMDEDGVRRVHRFLASPVMQKAIARYDETDGTEFEAGNYLLKAVPKGSRLDSQRRRDRKARAAPGGRYDRAKAKKRARKAVIRASGTKVSAKTKKTLTNAAARPWSPGGLIRTGTGLAQTKVA